jgi:hypothetical protein
MSAGSAARRSRELVPEALSVRGRAARSQAFNTGGELVQRLPGPKVAATTRLDQLEKGDPGQRPSGRLGEVALAVYVASTILGVTLVAALLWRLLPAAGRRRRRHD